jgi:hypothetical protein
VKASRRQLITTALSGGLAALPANASSHAATPHSAPPSPASQPLKSRYATLDGILKQPVLKRALFGAPVIIIKEIKQVADALRIPVANGEQDNSFYGFRWLLANNGIDIVQPDNYYFGG